MSQETKDDSLGTDRTAENAANSIKSDIERLAKSVGHDLSTYTPQQLVELRRSFTKDDMDANEAAHKAKMADREHFLKAGVVLAAMVLIGYIVWASLAYSSPAKRDDVIHDWMTMGSTALLGILAGFGLGRKG